MRRRYRIALWIALSLLALPVLLLVGVYWTANSDRGRGWIERTTARLTDGGVQLHGIGGHFPQQLQLRRLELRDPQGLWLSIDGLELQWSPSRLLAWRAQVALLQAANVSIARAPAYPHQDKPPSGAHHWPHVQLDRLDVERLDLGAALTGSAVGLAIEGSGSWVSLGQTQLALVARRLDAVPSTYRATAQIDDRQLQAQLDLEEEAAGPLAHLAQVPDIGALSIHLRVAGPREAVNTELALRAGALTGHISGLFNVRTGASTLEVTLDAPAMSPRPGLGWQRLKLNGQWRGALRAPETTARLEASGVVAPGLSLASVSAQLQGHAGALTLDASGTGLALSRRVGTLLAAQPLTAHALMHLDQTGYPIEFTLSHPLIDASGRWSGGAADGSGKLDATVTSLGALAPLTTLDLQGRGSVSAQVHSHAGAWHIDATGQLKVGGGRSPLAPLLTPSTSLDAAVTFDERGMQLERAQVESSHLQASAHGGYHDGLDMSWKVTLPELSVLAARLGGHASAEGQVQGRSPQLAISADINGEVALGGSRSGPLRVQLHAADVPQRPNGELELSGTLDEAPLEFHASVLGQPDGSMEAKIDRGRWKSLQAQGAVRIASRAGAPQGELQVSMAHLEDLDRLLGQQLQGQIDARVDFDGAQSGGRARLRVTAQDAGVPAQQLKTLELAGTIDSLTSRPELALQLSAQTLLSNVPANLTAELRGPLDAVALQIKAASEGDADTSAQLTTTATLDAEHRELRLAALQIDYHGQQARLLAPATLSFGDGLAVDQLRVGVGDSVWQAQGRLTPALDLRASLHDLSPDLLRPWMPNLQVDGRLNADLDVHGSIAEPSGTVHVEAHGLRARSGSGRSLPAGDLTADAQLQSSVAQLQVKAGAGERLQLQVSGQAPLNREAPIALKLGGTFDLVLLNAFVEASGQRLRGQVKLDADIAGSLAEPQAHGSVALTQGDLQDYPRGVRLTEVSATLTAAGDQLQLSDFTAHAGPGTISMTGSLGLTGDLPLSLKLEAHNARPLNSDLITATLDMDLTLIGPLRQQLEAAGKLHIVRADLNIPNALPPDIAVLDVRRTGQKSAPPPRSSIPKVGLNVAVDAPRAVFVKGRGLDAELGGDLHIGGNNRDPTVSGGFDLRHGTINLAGSTLTFASGRVSFNGTGLRKKIDPTLDFTATNSSGGATYTLNVGGYADAPVITLSSSPEQPQDQILSRLLFGADPAQLTTLQIAQIAAALATMSGIGGNGFNPINAVQRKLRLDRLAISGSTTSGPATGTGPAQGTNTGASIEAGRYVSSRVFVGAKQFTTGTTQAEVQVDLTRSLKIQTALGTGGGTVQGESPQNDPGSSIGLSYQFEY
jgi:translocation and assembly module TamB